MSHDNSPPYHKLSTLVDSFSGNLSGDKWHVYPNSDITESVGGKLQFFNSGTASSRMDSVHLYDFDSASVRIDVGVPPRYVHFAVKGIHASSPDAGYRPEFRFIIEDGTFAALVQNYMVDFLDDEIQILSTRPYDPTTMAYLRIHVITEGRTYPEYQMNFSPNGIDWQTWIFFDARGPLMDPVSGWRVEFYADTGTSYLSNFNTGGSRLLLRTGAGTWVNASGARVRSSDGHWRDVSGLMLRTSTGTWTNL